MAKALAVLLLVRISLAGMSFRAVLPLAVFPAVPGQEPFFRLSAWNGDAASLRVDVASGGGIIQIRYNPDSSRILQWAGCSWTFPEYNWGDIDAGVDLRGAAALVLSLRSVGRSFSVFVTCGGNYHLFPDSASRHFGECRLTPAWQTVRLSLRGLDLRHIGRLVTVVFRKEALGADAAGSYAIEIRQIRVE